MTPRNLSYRLEGRSLCEGRGEPAGPLDVK
jgi:hypothetical protein